MFRNPAIDAIVVLIIVLLIVGPKRLPSLGKGLGQGMREFKDGITGESKDEPEKPTLSEPTPMPESTRTQGEHAAASGSASAGSDRQS